MERGLLSVLFEVFSLFQNLLIDIINCLLYTSLPTTEEEMQKVFERIGIGKQDEFGQPYEEWFITDYECPIYGVQKMLGEYESLDKLNYLAALIDELSLSDQEKLVAIMEAACRIPCRAVRTSW